MPTFTAFTTLPGREPARALGLALERLEPEPTGVGVFEVENGKGVWEVGGYFLAQPDRAGLALLETLFQSRPFVISELPDVDWVAKVKRALSPVEAGRFFVYGSHDADKLPPEKIGLLIEAAMAFGTGHHGTTQGCLLALEKLIVQDFQPQSVVDIGCGTAVLAMAAAKVWPGQMIASDIDKIAVETAAANARENGLEGRLLCVQATGFDHEMIADAGPFDLIFANILKGPLIALAQDMCLNSKASGKVILSGILITQATDVISAYRAEGFELVDKIEIGEWVTLTLYNR